MGEVKKQSFQTTLLQYAGIALGYFNSVILFTNVLDTEQYGLTRVLFAISVIYVNFSSLGTPKTLIKFFPYFKSDDNRNKGILFFAGLVSLVGFLIATFIYVSLKGWIIDQYIDKTPLFTENYYYVILLSFLMLYTNIMENFMIARKRTVLPYFLKSVFIRVVWMIEIILYYFDVYDFQTFLFYYVASYGLNFVIMFFYQWAKGYIKFNLEFLNMRRRVVKVLVNYGFFSIVTGISNLIVNRIDIIMITFLLGLSSTSVYAIAYYISSVILVPSTSIYRIAMPVVADLWKKKNLEEMQNLYFKSSINQIALGGLVFLMIWLNIDDLFTFLKPEYSAGKWVVLILSCSVLYNMSTGINNVIIMITKYYRYDTVASLSLMVITIVTNLIFIPTYGLEGAALATFISVVSYHTYKFVLIKVKFDMLPFNQETLKAIVVIGITSLIYFLPDLSEIPLVRIFYKSILIGMVYVILLYGLNISEDINQEINKLRKRIVK